MSHDRILPPSPTCVDPGCEWPSVDSDTGLCAVHFRNFRRAHPEYVSLQERAVLAAQEAERVAAQEQVRALELAEAQAQVDELQARRDRAVKPMTFRRWLFSRETREDSRFDYLREAMLEASRRVHGEKSVPHTKMFPSRFKREVYIAALGFDEQALEILILAEMEWRAERQARGGLAAKMEIDTASALDFRNPAQHQAQFCRFLHPHGNRSGPTKGTFCRAPAVPGTVRCVEHGGEFANIETRRAVLMSSYLQLVEATEVAVDCLVDVTLNSRNDLARVQAATQILDRAGLTAELNVTIKLEGEEKSEKMSHLRDKLDSMQRGLMAQVIEATAT